MCLGVFWVFASIPYNYNIFWGLMEYGEFGGYGLLEARLGPFLRKDAPAPSGWVILGWVGRQFIMCQGRN